MPSPSAPARKLRPAPKLEPVDGAPKKDGLVRRGRPELAYLELDRRGAELFSQVLTDGEEKEPAGHRE